MNYAKETEEIIESALVAAVAAALPGISVEGALAPVFDGEVKTSDSTYVNVTVDQESQNGDYAGAPPCGYSARITVRYALADDPTGAEFRAACRAVRAALSAFLGDGCSALNDEAEGWRCDEFLLDSTSTAPDLGESTAAAVKTYTATLVGRRLNTNNNEQEA